MAAPTLQKIYEKVIEVGMANDPRSASQLKKLLADAKKAYEKMEKKEQQYFDRDRLFNPYADTRVLFGDPKTPVKKLAMGIDVEAGELAVLAELNRRGAKIDLAVAHHPEGEGLAQLADMLAMQADVYAATGVSVNVIEKLLERVTPKLERDLHALNHHRSVDSARLLGLPFACFHTVADNCVYTYLTRKAAKAKLETVGDVVDMLLEEPEFQEAARRTVSPQISLGSRKSRAGKIVFTGFTGGTSGSADVYEAMKHAGVGTEVVMHLGKEHRDQAEKHHLNVVVASHMASDSLGINLLLDHVEKLGVEIVPLSGFIRVSRTGKKPVLVK